MSAGSLPPGVSDEGNGRYRVRVYNPSTRAYIQRRVVGLREARRVQAELRADVAKADNGRRRGRAPTVEAFGESWRTELRHGPLTEADVAATLRLHVYPGLGHLRVDEVTHRDAMGFMRRLEQTDLAPSTQGKIDSQVRALFGAVVADGWRDLSPFARVNRVRLSRAQTRRQDEHVPSAAEALHLADLARDEGRLDVWAFIRLAVGTGLRGGELVGLSVDELDYPQPTRLEVTHQLQRRAGGGFYLCPPKTEAGLRTVPLAPAVAETLAVLTAQRSPHEVTLPWVERGTERGERTVGLLLSGRYGPAPVHESVMARAVRALAERAGLPGRVTAHSLRKTYTTILGDAGVPLKVIDTVTGHESSGLTLGVYTTATAEGVARARQAVQNALTTADSENSVRAS
ncbi:tyrosine-type recombinase/integrase [Isoptericola sp. NPDC057191]|uniref:tyrosine-type recombinase/integrase n=1 Tax=Isoptericola sp. NPDC057191 TaxID=3346041 RepID=UPI0036406966